ncbi:MAG: hypothetical protein ACW96U_13820, partial [Candidatus Heimdallarchaeaceae archaeon]
MKKRLILTGIVFAILINQAGIQAATQNTDLSMSFNSALVLSDDLISAPSYIIDRILEGKEPIFKTDEAIEKYLVMDLFFESKNNVSTVIYDLNGDIVGAIKGYIGTTRMVDSETMLFENGSHYTFWNLVTNEMVHLEDNFGYHHDFEYNPITETFLGLGREQVGEVDIGGEMYPIEYDTIYECLPNGTVLWEWKGSENIPFDVDE